MKMTRMILVKSILLLSLLLTLTISVPVSNDVFDTIRQRVLETQIWPPPGNISGTIQSALNYSKTLNSSCYWSDIDYSDQRIVNWSTVIHMSRLTTMVQAITVDGSPIKNDPKIMSQVHCALQIWFNHDWQCPNWWYNEVLVPLLATSQLLMLGDNATSIEIQKITEISFRAAWWLHRPIDAGTNLIQMIQSELYRSLATKNATGLDEGFKRMWTDIALNQPGEQGVQYDWSYHFHGLQLMTGAYGIEWSNTLLLFVQVSQNTTFEPRVGAIGLLVDYVTLGSSWMIMKDQWDWHVVGRNIAGPGNGFTSQLHTSGIRSLAAIAATNESRELLLNFADRLEDKPNTPLLIGNKHFFGSDYQVHRRSNWIFTIKMQSVRTTPAECLNGENLKDEHGGQGVLNLYRIDVNDYLDVFPLIDWQAINGITVQHDIPLEECKGGTFPQTKLTFVGGVSDGQNGLAMMDTASHNLTAQRSWHFYDDAVIALATNLTVTIPSTAWTTLASRLLTKGQVSVGFFNSTIVTLKDGNYTFSYSSTKISNVQWIHFGDSNIGYILPLSQQYAAVGLQYGIQTGNYDTFGAFNVTVTARTVTLYIDHGQGPYTLDYNYMIVPNVSLESMPALIKQYNEEQVFACISTNKQFHGTMWPSLKRAAFVLWDNITTTFSCKSPTFEINIQLSNAGAFLYSENATSFTLSASHPTRLNTTLQVTVDRIGSGPGCTAFEQGNASKTNVTFALPISFKFQGQSTNVTCMK